MPLSSVVGAQSIVRPGVCTSSTRPASPYDGQVIYETDTDKTLVWNGSAWVYLATGTASPAVTTQPALVYVTGASFSAVSSVSFPTNTFTSTYRNYKIFCDITSASAVVTITGRLQASGSDNTTTNYFYGGFNKSFNNTDFSLAATSTTSWNLGRIENGQANHGGFVMDILGPQVADTTHAYGGLMYQSASPFYWGTINMGWAFLAGTQFDSFSIVSTGGNITGVYRVYGYSES